MADTPLERVTWLDSYTRLASWVSKSELSEEISKPHEPCITVGHVFGEDDLSLTLVLSLTSDAIQGFVRIPKVCITKRETLKASR